MNVSPQAIANIAMGMGVSGGASSIDALWSRVPARQCLRAGVTCFTQPGRAFSGMTYSGGVLYLHVPGEIVEIYFVNHDTHAPDVDVENRIAAFIVRRL
jgi:hypothetical protein